MWRTIRLDATEILQDKKAKKSLNRYFAVMNDEKIAKFSLAKKIAVEFQEGDPLPELWRHHKGATERFYKIQKEVDGHIRRLGDISPVENSYLDLKIEIAKEILKNCHFCVRGCEVNRFEGEVGYCRCGKEMSVSSIFPHMGEEPELVPSGTIFTVGCTMRCKHCQNWSISQHIEQGRVYNPKELAKEIEDLREKGCRNVNLVGGDPTPWLEYWLETFRHVSVNVPVVWNSNSYYSHATAQLLAGFVDVYLLDFKYGPHDCAEKISDAPRYWKTSTRNHLAAKKYGELIIRVLALPGHLECCTRPILEWIAENLGTDTRVNILFQYRPEWRASEVPELRRKLTREEKEKTVRLAKEVGLTNIIT
ncbi:MAG: radical SAM protein [Thermoproteota archaeon]